MNEYQDLISEFSSEAYLIGNLTVPESEWGDKKAAEKYLEKYWLAAEEYRHIWKPIQKKVFTEKEKWLPEMVFSEGYELITIIGGCLFIEEDFNQLKKCFLEVGDDEFVIVENTFGGICDTIPIRVKYPVNISWEELISGNFISSTIVDNSMKEYFVFGNSGSWGKYAASDAEFPLDIIGFKPKYSKLFLKNFQQSNEEWDKVKEWLPVSYRKRMGI